MGTLGAQLDQQFFPDSFDTSQVVGHVLKMCTGFVSFLCVIIINVCNQGVPCVRNSSYSFMPILLNLHKCFGHGPKACTWFLHVNNPQIILSLSPQVELKHFSGVITITVNR